MVTEVGNASCLLPVDLTGAFLERCWATEGWWMGIAGWQLRKKAQLLGYGCRDPVSFPILGLALYLNPNSLHTGHAEVLTGEGIAAPAILQAAM